MPIGRSVFTVWLSEDGSMPDLVKECIESQQKMCSDFGYTHKIIGFDNKFKDAKYAQECLNSPHKKKKWCKYSDYLREKTLFDEGGIYLDADVLCLPGKNFDDMLGHEMFCGKEKFFPSMGSAWLGSAVIGAEPHHWFMKEWISEVESKFRGFDEKNFESSMQILTNNFYLASAKYPDKMIIYEPEYFFPYCHFDNSTNITENTRVIHKFLKSWI